MQWCGRELHLPNAGDRHIKKEKEKKKTQPKADTDVVAMINHFLISHNFALSAE